LSQVSEDLSERADAFGLILDDVSLTHLTFGREFTTAVEQKQVAQQEAERARFVVEKVRKLLTDLFFILPCASRCKSNDCSSAGGL